MFSGAESSAVFGPRPKTEMNEIFARDHELELLHSNVGVPIIIVSGIRRIGKMSLLRVSLDEIDRIRQG